MDKQRRRIWIDLDNAPHIPFFAPVRKELQARGYDVFITASGRYQVGELAESHGIPYQLLTGGYYGKNRALKALGLLRRAVWMLPTLRRRRPDLAVSHGSRAQIIAAKMTGIPVVVIIDYEYVNFGGATLECLITPEVVPDSPRYKCRHRLKYPGIKEDAYACDFRPTGDILQELGATQGEIVVTVRPPATDAHYHNVESENLLAGVVRRVSKCERAILVMLPRSERQAEDIRETWHELLERRKMVIPQRSLPGLSLIWASDVVISGGGTMNREAAALGVPVYSIFRGAIGAVDRYLADTGRLTLIESAEDIDRLIKVEKRKRNTPPLHRSKATLEAIVNHIEAALRGNASTTLFAAGGRGR